MKEKKDFWDMSFNAVWGCKNNCVYCYARRIAKRYAEQIAGKEFSYWDNLEIKKHGRHLGYYSKDFIDKTIIQMRLEAFKPTWLESNYVRKFPKKPSIIFVNSMSDPAYWKPKWYEWIVKRIAENMQHTFVVLTKQPEIYREYTFPHNTILGLTINNNNDCRKIITIIEMELKNKILLSIEPIQEIIYYINLELIKTGNWSHEDENSGEICYHYCNSFDWIHVGQESGNRKERIRATPEMIEPFFDIDIPVFMKKNLEGIIPGRKLRRERILL